MSTITNVNSSYSPLPMAANVAKAAPANQNVVATQSPSPTKGASVLLSVSAKPTGVGAGPVSMTINDAVDAYQRNSGTVPASITLKGTTTEIQQNMDVLKAMMGGGVTISAIKLTDRGGHIDFDASTLKAGGLIGGLYDLGAAANTNATVKVLQKISGAYTLNIGNTTVSDVQTGFKAPTGATIKMKVVDTAAQVGAALTPLTNNKSKLTSITITDPSNPIQVLVPQIATYRSILGVVSSYKLDVTSASIKDYTSKLSTSNGQQPPTYTTNSNIGKISINDTAANLNANIAMLQSLAAAGTLKQVTVSDGKNITMDETAALADSALLGVKFVNGKGGTQVVSVSGVHVNKINDIENQVASNSSVELSEQINDTQANVSSDLTKIANAIGVNHIGRISFTDQDANHQPLTPTLTFVNKADYDNNKNVLKFVRGNYNLSIGNISAADAVSFTSPNSNASLKFNISDTAANLATKFDDLQTLAAAGKVTTIKSSDAQGKLITLTADQAIKDKAVITALNAGAAPYSIEVTGAKAADISTLTSNLTDGHSVMHLDKISFSDEAANLSANMSQIITLAATTKIGTISATGGDLNIQGSLLDSSGSLVTGAENLFGATFDDGSSGNIQVNVNGIAASHAKDVADLIVKNDSINNNGTLANETVTDTAANISSNMDSLEASATTSHTPLSAITVRDGGTVTVADVNEFNADQDAIDLINPNYKLTVTSASVADVATVKGDATVVANATLTFGVSDTAANITAHLDDLKDLVTNNQVSSIDSSDGTNKNITFTADQIGSHSNVFNKIGTGSVEVTGANATQAAKWLSAPALSSKISKIDIDLSASSDASDFVKNITALNTNATKIGTIDLGANTLTVDATTAKANTDILSKGDFSLSTSGAGGSGVALTVNDLTVADLDDANFKPIASNATVKLTDNISDAGVTVSGALDKLQANASIGKVKVNNADPVTVGSNAQYVKDQDLITGKLSGNFTLSAQNITVANANTMITNSVLPPGRLSFKITDTAANISAALSDLKTWNSLGELAEVKTTDNTNKAITIDLGSNSVSDLKGVISKIKGSAANNQFSINVTNATAVVAGSIQGVIALANSNATVSTVSVEDTGANIAANLSNLQTLAGSHNIGTVDVSDSALTLTSAQVSASSDLLASTFTSNSGTSTPVAVTVTGVAATDVGATLLAVNSNAGLNTTEVDVSDLAANLKTNIASLEAGAAGGIVQKIGASDGGTITLDETTDNTGLGGSATYDATDSTSEVTAQYQHALAAMTGTYGITITGISSQNVAAAETNITAAAAGHPDYKFGVVDDQSVLATVDPNGNGTDTYLETLQTYAAKNQLASITLASGSDPLGVTVAQVQNDSDALSKLDKTSATPNLSINDTAANIVDPTGLTDVNSLIANHGGAKTQIVLDTAAAATLTVAQLNSLNTTLGNAASSDLATQVTNGFSYVVSDHIGAVLNQASVDGTGATSLLGNAGASIKLLDDYTTATLTLPTSQKTNYTTLQGNGMLDSAGNAAPDPANVNWV